MNCPLVFSFLGLLLAGCAAVPTDKAVERTAMLQTAVVEAATARVAVYRFADDVELAAFPVPAPDVATLKELLGQGRPAVYEPLFISPPAPPFQETCLCIGAFKLNLEDIWSESREASQLECLKKLDGEGRLAPQIVLPDAVYERLMALDAIQQARAAAASLENEG